MKIRTQFIITMILFGIILAVIAASAVVTSRKAEIVDEQEKIANSIAQAANDLSYLTNDYLIYREGQQLKRWQTRFASLSILVSRLNVDTPDQQALFRNIQAHQQRIKEVFDSITSTQNQSAALDLSFFQVSWSRMAVQSQGLVSDSSRLSQLLLADMDHLRRMRTMIMYIMVSLFGLFLLVSYMLTYRRVLKSIATLQAGTAIIGSGNLDFTIREKKNDEIGDLSHAFNRMTANLKGVTASKSELEREIVEREKAETELRTSRKFLEIANRHNDLNLLLQEFVREMKEFTNCEAVGIRLLDEHGDIPYMAYLGFSREFYETESPLSIRTDKCMCINVVKGTTDPRLPFYTEGGSFYMNGTTRFLATVSEDDKGQTRNVCNQVGYESVALIPIHVGTHMIGLIHLADHTENMVPLNTVKILEQVASALGAGVQRTVAEEELRKQREWLRVTLSSIGDAVIASDTEGRITFLNPVAVTLTGWQSDEALGQPIRSVFRIINEKTQEPAEDLLARVLSEKRVVALANDTTLVTKDGYEIPIEDSAAPIKDSAGNLIGVVLVFHDVTERRRTQAALREAHERAIWLARFPDENPNPVLRVGTDGNILYRNQATLKFPGWACEVGQRLPDKLWAFVRETLAEKGETQQDVNLNGRIYSVAVAPFQEEGYCNVYGRDITMRRQVEEALRASEEQFRRAIEDAPIPVIMQAEDGQVLEISRTWTELTGYTPENMPTFEAWLNRAYGEGADSVRSHMQGLFKGTLPSISIDLPIITYDGLTRQWSFSASAPGTLADGRRFIVGMAQDITERKRMEEELRQSEEKSRLLIKYAPTMFYEIDFHGPAFKSVNDAMCQFLGYTREELLAMNPFDLLDDEGKALFRERIRRKLAGEDITDSVEYQSITKDGRQVYGILNISFTYKDGKPEGAVVVAHDLTERKRAEESLKQRSTELQELAETLEQRIEERTKELAEANRAMRQLSIRLLSAQEEERKRVAGEIHDSMGSCLSGIKFKVESALEEIAKTPKVAAQSLNSIVPVIQEAIEECRRIQMDLRPSMLDDLGLLPTLSWFFRRFQTIYSAIHVEKELTIQESELPNSLKIVMYRIIQEAMNNAAKHSKADLVRVSIRKVHNKMELTVKDNGCGFSVQQRAFLEASKRGLGLTSMRERTELSGGSFAMESAEGTGTIIRASWTL